MIRLGFVMRLNRIFTIGILALLIGIVFVQISNFAGEVGAQPADPSLSIKVTSPKQVEYTPSTVLTFRCEVEYLKTLPTSQVAFVSMHYDIVEDPITDEPDPHFVNKTVEVTIIDRKADVTFTLDLGEDPPDLPYGNQYVVKFIVREDNETGEWQDSDTVDVLVGAYYDFSIVEVVVDDANRKEGELIDIDVTVRNDGNHEFPARIVAFVDEEELTYEEATVGMGETKTITIGWDNPEPGKHDVYVELYAKIIEGGEVITSEKLDESEPIEVEIEEDTEIPWPYWVIFGFAVVIILVIIAVIIKTNRKKPEEEEGEMFEEEEKKSKKGKKKD